MPRNYFSPPPSTKTQEVFKGDQKINQIIFRGDSWGAWGGSIYSVPAILQTLLFTAGFNIQVKDISAIGVNVANFFGRAQREDWGAESLHVQCFQPDTDPTFDVWSLSFDQTVPAEEMETFGFWNGFPEGRINQMKAATTATGIELTEKYWLAATFKSVIKAFLGTTDRNFIFDAQQNNLEKATALSPLDPEGKKF